MYASLIALTLAVFGQVGAEPAGVQSAVPSVAPATQPLPPTPAEQALKASPGITGDCRIRADITAEHDSVISAEVEGMLTKLPIKEGMHVAGGQVLATIDDRQAQAAVKVADLQYKAAVEKANDKIEETFAVASRDFAKKDLEKDMMANRGAAKAVTDIQIEQKILALKKASLQIDKALKDRTIALKETEAKGAEVEAAQIALDRRTLRAPFDGEVQEVNQKQAQWVNPGDPVLRLVQFDTLRAVGFVNARDFDPVDLANHPVTISVNLARDRTATAKGRVTFVSQTVVLEKYQVLAEFPNQRDGQFWLIRPGLEAEMTIHLNEPPVEATAQK
jgi:multidrug efflux pump subunit AcrA (membrane-fusion protein)